MASSSVFVSLLRINNYGKRWLSSVNCVSSYSLVSFVLFRIFLICVAISLYKDMKLDVIDPIISWSKISIPASFILLLIKDSAERLDIIDPLSLLAASASELELDDSDSPYFNLLRYSYTLSTFYFIAILRESLIELVRGTTLFVF